MQVSHLTCARVWEGGRREGRVRGVGESHIWSEMSERNKEIKKEGGGDDHMLSKNTRCQNGILNVTNPMASLSLFRGP
jgi:hypothetical protein